MTIELVPYHQDALRILAERIIQEQQHKLPDLSDIFVLIPDFHPRPRLLRLLFQQALQQNVRAIIPPRVTTLQEYIESSHPNRFSVPDSLQRTLILVEALSQHRDLFSHSNLWTVADVLMSFFEELTLNKTALPKNLNHFIALLKKAYGVEDVSAIGIEARLIHTLWHAWNEQLSAEGKVDPAANYLIKLANDIEQTDDTFFYATGLTTLLPAERKWFMHKLEQGQLNLLLHGQAQELGLHPDSLLHREFEFCITEPEITEHTHSSQWLNAAFFHTGDNIHQRAQQIRDTLPQSPVKNKIRICAAVHFEEEARLIEVQVRQWLMQDKKHLGLIIENRQLARRVRALLERANIHLRDASGWALSTTSAAASLESWLQTVEEDFAYRPFMDTLKSHFSFTSLPAVNSDFSSLLHYLEADVIRHENIARNLDRYKKAVLSRQSRIHANRSAFTGELITVLDFVALAANPLIQLRHREAPAQQYIAALKQSLQSMGMLDTYAQDPAGQKIIELLDQLSRSSSQSKLLLNWEDFRSWLGRSLEKQTFKPEQKSEYYVDLLHLPQSTLGHYDALIIANMSRDHFPGSDDMPFFNNAVRHELKLPSRQQQHILKFYHFRRLLESADDVLLSYHSGDMQSLPCPWLEVLETFHKLCYKQSLNDEYLLSLARDSRTEIRNKDAALPTPKAAPSTALDSQLIPDSLSASAHQSLINCPYTFFLGSGLKLQAPEEIRETLAKNDYGGRVHLCLEAFHKGVKGLPGPFANIITIGNSDKAISLLESIAQAVFNLDVEQNFQHRGWLKRWQAMIPAYVEWQRLREENWRVDDTEKKTRLELGDNIFIHGRIDRLDRNEHGKAVLDYKTGSPPDKPDVLSGEAVQLTHYALSCDEPVYEALYLKLDKPKVESKVCIEGDELRSLSQDVSQRLLQVIDDMHLGAPLSAWGDNKTCEYCRFQGICRKGTWQENPDHTDK